MADQQQATETVYRPKLAQARGAGSSGILDQAIAATMARGFDPDLYHVMEREDDALISDEILHGSMSGAFVYDFRIQGSQVTGISVIGAAQLASQYGGIKHRIITTIEKRGSLFIFSSYPTDTRGMDITTRIMHDLADEMDFYKVVVEVENIKNGNTVQMETSESRQEMRSDKSGYFDRPNYQKIAQSKAYRNGVLRVIPQSVQIPFKEECLKRGKSKDVSGSVIDEKRAGVLAYSTKNGLGVSRDAVFALGWAEINGLSDAAREGKLPAFAQAALALGIIAGGGEFDPGTGEVRQTAGSEAKQGSDGGKPRGRPPGSTNKKADGGNAGPTGPEPPPADERGQSVPAQQTQQQAQQREPSEQQRQALPPPPPASVQQQRQAGPQQERRPSADDELI
jgi:hypothetical protein